MDLWLFCNKGAQGVVVKSAIYILNPSRRNGRNSALGPKLPENIKLSESLNGKGIHSGLKHLSHGLNLIKPRRGRVGKVKHIHSSWAHKLNGKWPTPLLQIIKNRWKRDCTWACKTVGQSESISLNSPISKKREKSRQQGVPRILTEGNYY